MFIHRWSEAVNNPYIYRLSIVHRRLDEEIRSEWKRRFPDTLRLARLKKLRLAIKDRMVGLLRPASRGA